MNRHWLAWVWCAWSPLVLAQVSVSEQDLDWQTNHRPAIKGTENPHKQALMPAPSAEGIEPIWSIETSDVTLSNTLLRWSQQEKWQLIWEADRDFPILATVYLKGNFQSAILSVMQSLAQTDYPLQAILHTPSKVVRIVRHMQTPNS